MAKINVGQKVKHKEHGWGKVMEIIKHTDRPYLVQFENGLWGRFKSSELLGWRLKRGKTDSPPIEEVFSIPRRKK